MRFCLAALMSANLLLGQAKPFAMVRLGGELKAVRFDDPAQPQQPVAAGKSAADRNAPATPATNSKPPQGRRSKVKIGIGLAAIGGGIALMIANPDLTEQYLPDSKGNLYRQYYHARLIGGSFAGMGGVSLALGMRRR